MSTTIVLVDDHSVMQKGLRLLRESVPNFQAIQEPGDERELAAILKPLRPGVLVVDLMTVGMHGLESIRKIHAQAPETRVLFFSMCENIACAVEDGTTGPKAYVLEKSTSEELVEAIRKVIAGRQQLSSTHSRKVGKTDRSKKAKQNRSFGSSDPYETLTRREREVLHLVGEGLSSAEIARQLVISPRTVDMHRWHIMRKLKLRGQAALARYAIQRGLASYGD